MDKRWGKEQQTSLCASDVRLLNQPGGFIRISSHRADRKILLTVEIWIICHCSMQNLTMKSSVQNKKKKKQIRQALFPQLEQQGCM